MTFELVRTPIALMFSTTLEVVLQAASRIPLPIDGIEDAGSV